MIYTAQLTLQTRGRACHEITRAVAQHVVDSGCDSGLCSLFIQHTSAALMICENADPQVLVDLEQFMQALVVDGDPAFKHDAEGPDDMPAHIRAVLTHMDLTMPIRNGRLALGTWQGIYLWEHRAHPHQRQIMLTIYGG